MTDQIHVKICGITTLEDAIFAVEAGAGLLGFNFYPSSPRSLSVDACARITAGLEQRGLTPTRVGVFVNASVEEIESVMTACSMHLAQLSGDETPETLAALGGRAYKALRPTTPQAAREQAAAYTRRLAPALLLDAPHRGEYGGTGQTGDWEIARRLAARYPLLLAGGLTPANVARAVAEVQPWGVDVASGVESAPGRKDPARLLAFIQAVRASQKENPT